MLGPAQQVVDEITAAGGAAVANTDDISTWDGAKASSTRRWSVFGGLDVVVNNAGILRDRMLVNMSEEEWDSVIRVHLKGTFAASRHAAAYWRDRTKAGETNDARIINTTSVSGIYGNIGQANYGAAKAGIAGLHDHRRPGAGPLRRDRQRHRPRRPHPHDRGPADPRRREGGARPPLGGAGLRLAGLDAVGRRDRADHRGVGHQLRHRRRLAPGADRRDPSSDPTEVDAAIRKLLADARPHTNFAETTNQQKNRRLLDPAQNPLDADLDGHPGRVLPGWR